MIAIYIVPSPLWVWYGAWCSLEGLCLWLVTNCKARSPTSSNWLKTISTLVGIIVVAFQAIGSPYSYLSISTSLMPTRLKICSCSMNTQLLLVCYINGCPHLASPHAPSFNNVSWGIEMMKAWDQSIHEAKWPNAISTPTILIVVLGYWWPELIIRYDIPKPT